MATHTSILAWRIPWTEEPGMLHAMSLQESDMTKPPWIPLSAPPCITVMKISTLMESQNEDKLGMP